MVTEDIARAAQSLSTKAMLVNLNVRVWGARKYDKAVSAQVEASTGAKAGAGRYNKCLIDPDALKPIVSAAGAVRGTHYKYTSPWLDDGARVLSSAAYFEYVKAMTEVIRPFDKAADELEQRYPMLHKDAQAVLGTMFNSSEYPVSIRDKFSVGTLFLPFPTAEDFRVTGLNGNLDDIKKQISDAAVTVEGSIKTDCAYRITEVVGRIVDRMKAYTGGREGSFRNSLLENARDLVELLPLLNVTGDSDIAAACADLDKLTSSVDVSALREDEALRKQTAADAEAIYKKMQAFV